MVHKQQMLERKAREKNGTVTKGSDEIKVMYTNLDGIIASKELVSKLSKKKKKIVCLAEAKLCQDIHTNIENDNSNSIWRKDRKDKKGGVMQIIKSA